MPRRNSSPRNARGCAARPKGAASIPRPARLPGILGKDVRVLHAPCIGRCETAPAAVVGQNPVTNASVEKIVALVKSKSMKHPAQPYVDYAAYRAKGGYELAKSCVEGERK